jgi:hypothetical protein
MRYTLVQPDTDGIVILVCFYVLPGTSSTESMAYMNRRQFAISALSASTVFIGCDTDQKPSHAATLLNNGEVQEALKSFADAIDNLAGDVGDFDTKE